MGDIWNAFHQTKENSLSAAVPGDRFALLMERGETHPNFLLPIPRDAGFIFVFMQMQTAARACVVTALGEYQQFGGAVVCSWFFGCWRLLCVRVMWDV